MVAKRPTHFRMKVDGVTLPGRVYREGEVVAIEDLDFNYRETLDTILASVAGAGNDWRLLETGVLNSKGEFVPKPEPGVAESDAADEPTEG